jgi:hypothetical protein
LATTRDENETAKKRNALTLEERINAIASRNQAAARPGHDNTVTIRHVDPATIRPEGWTPGKKKPKNPINDERKQAIVDLLLRSGPIPKSDLHKHFGWNANTFAKLMRELDTAGRIEYGDRVEPQNGGGPSPLVHAVEDDPRQDTPEDIAEDFPAANGCPEPDSARPGKDMPEDTADLSGEEPPVDSDPDPTPEPAAEAGPTQEEEQPMSLAEQHRQTADDRERDDGGRPVPVLVPRALDLLAEHGPMRQADLRKLLDVQSSVMATVVVPGLRDAGVDFGEPVDRSPVLSLDGDERPFESASDEVGEPGVEVEPTAPAEPPALREHGASTLEFEEPLHAEYMQMLRGLIDVAEGEGRDRLVERYVRRLMGFVTVARDWHDIDRFCDEIERALDIT